ncbi:coiled-coil domain-containing protein 66 isoform X2 [Myxocyprinus asiaticus]|uniref:coiled-coil domain-containing protein 66 isoform X2 n=1 Tax=Myxocyprinus asiaticus TaxID=70543 RepID=UPI002223E079|nr:coiled-coil domain-containing protein 66 isoform X2 [Myxocyprinus asiaticus]
MMNLGDGLLFELENGKPRLVLAKYSAESKSSNKKVSCQVPSRKRTQKIISSKLGPSQQDKPEQDKKCKDTAAIGSVGQNIKHEPRKSKAKGRSDSISIALRVPSEINRNHSSTKESLVCLTQEQFQQILNSINTSTAHAQHEPNTQTHTEAAVNSEENCPAITAAEELLFDDNNHAHRVSQVKREIQPVSDELQSGLFSTFGERERERDALEAKRAQWRSELDEQMALKRKQKASVKDLKTPAEARFKHQPTTVHDGSTATGTDNSNPRAAVHAHKQLPAAIRSAFILGEAAPVEGVYSAHREEQQRLWLQELHQQREEAKLRRQQEKQMNSQTEDLERWAVHFDSLHRPLAVEPDTSNSLSPHHSVSGGLSTAWEAMSVCGGDSVGRASVDTPYGPQQRARYLRTMTALLDPVQIEERERRRLKQFEHQRAIEAQVEERRRQKEREEATRRAQEQEEERRVERERERLQQQFINDTKRQRNREELQSRKTEELYLSIQRAQVEAFKDKHLQRIKDLAKKGHDVSKLLHSLEGGSISQVLSGHDSPGTSGSLTSSVIHLPSTTSPRKDTAVQTEVSHLPENDSVCDTEQQSLSAAVTHTVPANILTTKKSRHSNAKASERSHGKENMCTTPKDSEVNPNEPFARTDRNRAQQLVKRPEWNTQQRPRKAFVPASERYPESLQKHRQQSRKQREMELMTLVERNTVSRTAQPNPPHAANNHKPPAHMHRNSPQLQSENQWQELSAFTAESRVCSPPVPAVKNRLQQPPQHMMEEQVQDTGRPSSLDYVPYIRTDEVYHMDPLAPLFIPSTHEAQQRVHTDVRSKQATPLVQPDPTKSTQRQQAILKGLSELRQGLLQRQKEIETSLNPLMQTQHRNHFPTF